MTESISTATEVLGASDKLWKLRAVALGFAAMLGGLQTSVILTQKQLQQNVDTLVSTVSAQTITVTAITLDHIRTDAEVKKNRELDVLEQNNNDRIHMEMLRRIDDAIDRL